MTTCLDDATIAALSDGALSEPERAVVEDHVVGCDACHSLVAAVLRVRQSSVSGPRPRHLALRRGAGIDRYVVLRALGAGAQGEVVEAYDPVLDRRVAIKCLAPPREGSVDAAALREARMMARLAHPNVVPVHDVGVAEGRPFVVMERIEGATLRAWLGERRRSWQAVVGALCEAGRGLAAAHAAGVVHGDFKPDNVLVTRDDRFLVGDFGLSKSFEVTEDTGAPLSPTTTSPRGTPAYMAPELRGRGEVTPASDQYAFCVTLHEALFGRWPQEARARRGATAALGRVPRAVRTAVARGLADDPARRHRSMDALVGQLARARARSAFARGGVVVGLVAAVAVAVYVAGFSPAALERVAGARLAGVWDGPRRAAVRKALLSTGVRTAESSWQIVAREIDRYAGAWSSAYAATLGLRPLRAPSERRRDEDLRACLELRRDELRTMVDVLEAGGADLIERAPEAALGLRGTPFCPPGAAVTATGPRAVSAREQIARATVMIRLSRFDEAHQAAAAALADARAVADDGLAAEALELSGNALGGQGRLDEATATLQEAAWTAEASHQDYVVAKSWIALVYYVGYVQGRRQEGHVLERHARAALARIGDPPLLASMLHGNLASLIKSEGRLREALEEARQAVSTREQAFGARDWRVAMALQIQGRTERMLGDYGSAAADLTRAAEIIEAELGADNPHLSFELGSLSLTELRLGRIDAAVAHAERALRIRELGAHQDTREVASALDDAGVVLHAAGRLADAEERLRRALSILERIAGADGSPAAEVGIHLAEVRTSAGEAGEAVALADAARAVLEASGPPAMLAEALVALGRARAARGDIQGAVADLSRAVTISEGALGHDHADTAVARARLGEALLAAGRRDEGVAAIAEAVRVLRAARADPALRAAASRAAGIPLTAEESGS